MKNRFHKLFHWEYWPLLMFYIPNIPFALFHGIKIRSLVFYTGVNPGIRDSGIGSESKYETLQLLPKEYIPKSILHQKNQKIDKTLKEFQQSNIQFPIIIKPDIGFRGLLVKKIETELELKCYLEKYPVAFIIQEFLNHANECGIFYYRHPNEKLGKVTSLTLKEFLIITGDGKSSLKELVLKNKRASLYYGMLEGDVSIEWDTIIEKGTSRKLSSIGNHSKGTRFINGNHLINKTLEETLNSLNHQVKGWYYGRLDVKYNSLEELYQGDFKVLEINGILAEPTHIYDANNMTYLKALKTIRVHWKQLYEIAAYNHKSKGVSFRKTIPFVREMLALKSYSKRLKKLSKK
tara:strand:- start:79157 stop:80203 length:1047 start_codon:yes stop_codon:yes gene_type:complete